MVRSVNTVDRLSIRMTFDDRVLINRMITHKRIEFQTTLIEGIMAFLKKHAERKHVTAERNRLNNYLTVSRNRKREQLAASAQKAQESTHGAPMGTGAAAGLAVQAISSAGSALLSREQAQQDKAEYEGDLASAQLNVYIKNTSPRTIAHEVARRLGDRYQLILFRLAPGEDGYIKLAEFLVSSIRKFALEKLRRHDGDVVKAFIDAAIPTSKDDSMYREYGFLTHKTLALHDAAEDILSRCGPAVRSLMGGHRDRYDPETGHTHTHNTWTMHGLLTGTLIVDGSGNIIRALDDGNRRLEDLDGLAKYPPALLAVDENPGDLGFSFGTAPTGRKLNDFQVVALQRIVPPFFEPRKVAIRRVRTHRGAVEEQEVHEDLSARRYPAEKYEVPWSRRRDEEWQSRMKTIHARKLAADEPEIVVVTDQHRLQAMEAASADADLQWAVDDLTSATDEAHRLTFAVLEEDCGTGERNRKQLESATIAKHVATSVSNLMSAVVRCKASDEEHFQQANDAIHTAEATLYMARDLPQIGSQHHTEAASALVKVHQHSNTGFRQLQFAYLLLDLVWEGMYELAGIDPKKELRVEQQIPIISIIKSLKDKAKEEAESATAFSDLVRVSCEADDDTEATTTSEALFEAFNAAKDAVRTSLDEADAQDLVATASVIERCIIEISQLAGEIRLLLAREDVVIEWVDRWANGLAQDLGPQALKSQAIERVEAALAESQAALNAVQTERNASKKPLASIFRRATFDANARKMSAFQARERCQSIMQSIFLQRDTALTGDADAQPDTFLQRAVALFEFNLLRILYAHWKRASSHRSDQVTGIKTQWEALEARHQQLKRTRLLLTQYWEMLPPMALEPESSPDGEGSSPPDESAGFGEHKNGADDPAEEASGRSDRDRTDDSAVANASTDGSEAGEPPVDMDDHASQAPASGVLLSSVSRLRYAERQAIEASENADSFRSQIAIGDASQRAREAMLKRMRVEEVVTPDIVASDFIFNTAKALRDDVKQSNSTLDEIQRELQAIQRQSKYGNDQPVGPVLSDADSDISREQDEAEQAIGEIKDYLQRSPLSKFAKPERLESVSDLVQVFIYRSTRLCLAQSDCSGMAEEDIKTALLEVLDSLSLSFEKGSIGLVEHWGSFLMAGVAEVMLKHTQSWAEGCKAQVKGATEAFKVLQEQKHAQWADMQLAVSQSVKHIRLAYTSLDDARIQCAENARRLHMRAGQWDLGEDICAWAARLTVTERKWLDGELAALAATRKPPINPPGRSPQLIAYLTLLAYSDSKLNEQRETIRELYRLKRPLELCHVKLREIRSRLSQEQQQEQDVSNVRRKHDRLAKKLNEKIRQEEARQDDLRAVTKRMLAQGLRIAFNQWQTHTLCDTDSTLLTQAIKQREESTQAAAVSHTRDGSDRGHQREASPSELDGLDEGSKLESRDVQMTKDQFEDEIRALQALITPIVTYVHAHSPDLRRMQTRGGSRADSSRGLLGLPGSEQSLQRGHSYSPPVKVPSERRRTPHVDLSLLTEEERRRRQEAATAAAAAARAKDTEAQGHHQHPGDEAVAGEVQTDHAGEGAAPDPAPDPKSKPAGGGSLVASLYHLVPGGVMGT